MCEEGLLEEYLETGHISVPSIKTVFLTERYSLAILDRLYV